MARKVNTRFLIIVTIVICCALIGAVGLKYVYHHGPAYYASLAEKRLAAGDLQEAAQDYGRAFYASHPPDPNYLIKQGDLFIKLTARDPQMLGYAVSSWRKALEIDPQNVLALQRLLDIVVQEVQMGVHAETLTMLTDYATRLHEADPSNAQAAAWVKIAPVDAYIGGVATDPIKLERQLIDLQKVSDADPSNVQAMMALAQARLRLSEAAGQRNDPDEADKQRQLAMSTFNSALKKQPNNPDVWLHAAVIDSVVMRAMQMRLANAEQDGLAPDEAKKSFETLQGIRQQCMDNLHHGQSLLKPSDDNYEDLGVLAIEVNADLNDPAAAVKACQDLLKNRPDSLQGRLLYARLLKQNPEKWQEAVAILSAPTSANSNPTGVKASSLKYQQFNTLAELTEIRIDLASTETDPAKKAALMQQVQDGYAQLSASVGETPQTLKLKGRILQLQGKTIDAIQALEKAQAAYKQAGQMDPELTNALAMTYWHVGQTGQARKLFKELIDSNPTYMQARIMLAELLLEENDAKDAEPQLQALEHYLPNNVIVVQLRLASDLAQGNLDHAKTLYVKLPEKTTHDQEIKAQMAQKMNNLPEAIRLVEMIRASQTDDTTAVEWLTQLYLQQGQRDKALKVVDQSLAAHPSQHALELVRQQILANSPLQKEQVAQQAIEDSSLTPAGKELQLYELSREQNKNDEAMQHLDKAEQLGPNDPHVLEIRLANLLLQKKWDDAQKYIDRLVKLNATPAAGLLYQQQLALARGNFDQAIDLANQVIAKMPEFANGYIAMGEALQGEGRYQQAIDKYLDALDRQNNNLRAIQGLINSYYALNRPQDAARYIASARQTNPNEPIFREMEIEHSLKYGDATLAITAREAAAKADPNDAAKEQDLAMAYLRAAEYRIKQNDTSGAQPYVDKLRALIADGMQRWPDNRAFFGLAGELSLTTKDYAAGEAAMNRMIAQPQWNTDPATYLIVSDFYRQSNNMDKAEAALREALDKGGGADYRMALAELLSQRGEPDKALALLEPMVETDDIREERVRILLGAKRVAEAEPILQSLLAKNPNSPQLQQQLLEIQAGEGKSDALMATATAMLAKDPKNDTALYYRGLAKIRQASPDLDGAMSDLNAVLQDDPTNVDTRYWLAEIYRQRNDWDSAISQIQQGLTAQPNNKILRLKLIELNSTTVPPRWDDVEQLINTALADPQMQSDPTWQLSAASMWQSRGDIAQCLAAYQAALKLAPKDPSIFQSYVNALLWANQPDQVLSLTDTLAHANNSPAWVHDDRAVAAARLKQPSQAKAEILAAIAAPDAVDSSVAILTLVQSATASGQIDTALDAIGNKTSGNPRWQMLAGYLEHARNQDGAAADFMSQAAVSTTLSSAEKVDAARWASMLNMTRQPPDFEKAVAMSKLVLASQPDNTEQLNNLACMLVDSVKPPRPAEALQYSQHAYDLMRKSGINQPLIEDTQGWVLVNNGRVQDGMLLLRQVVDDKPFIDAYYHLAEAYLRSNQPAAALTQLKLASQTLDDLKRNKQAYDQTLPSRIEAAQEQARQMSKMQASTPQ
jgi:tetratricopeptide (TPR) repeat protein